MITKHLRHSDSLNLTHMVRLHLFCCQMTYYDTGIESCKIHYQLTPKSDTKLQGTEFCSMVIFFVLQFLSLLLDYLAVK